MTTKIKSVTIVNKNGINEYVVGNRYNGLLIGYILNCSIEFPESFSSMYQGHTATGDLVFEAVNAPVDVAYIEDDKD